MIRSGKKLVELKNVSLVFNKGKKNEVKAIMLVCHGMAGRHVLVALYLHAHLRRLGCAPGGSRSAGAGRLSGQLLCCGFRSL